MTTRIPNPEPRAAMPPSGRMTSLATILQLHFDDRYFRAPHATVTPLVAAVARAARVPGPGIVTCLRHAEIAEILQNRRIGAMNSRCDEQQSWSEGLSADWLRRTLAFLDPPIELVRPRPAWAPATALRTLEHFPMRVTPA